jgi:hypothetical protein
LVEYAQYLYTKPDVITSGKNWVVEWRIIMNKDPEDYRINWLHHLDRMEGNGIPKVWNVGLLHEAEEMLEDLDSNEDGIIQ